MLWKCVFKFSPLGGSRHWREIGRSAPLCEAGNISGVCTLPPGEEDHLASHPDHVWKGLYWSSRRLALDWLYLLPVCDVQQQPGMTALRFCLLSSFKYSWFNGAQRKLCFPNRTCLWAPGSLGFPFPFTNVISQLKWPRCRLNKFSLRKEPSFRVLTNHESSSSFVQGALAGGDLITVSHEPFGWIFCRSVWKFTKFKGNCLTFLEGETNEI